MIIVIPCVLLLSNPFILKIEEEEVGREFRELRHLLQLFIKISFSDKYYQNFILASNNMILFIFKINIFERLGLDKN